MTVASRMTICCVLSHMIFFCVLDFGTGTRTIKSEDYDRIVKIAANMTALLSQENGNFISVNAIDIMHLRNLLLLPY